LSIRGLPFQVFGELGLKRRYAAVALPEAMLDAGARAKTVTKAAKAGQKRPKVATRDDFSPFTDYRLLVTGWPFPGARQKPVTKGAKSCQKVTKSANAPLDLWSVVCHPWSRQEFLLFPSLCPGARAQNRCKKVQKSAERCKTSYLL